MTEPAPRVNLSRRGFVAGLLAAPAIVRAASLMPIRAALVPSTKHFEMGLLFDEKWQLESSMNVMKLAIGRELRSLGLGATVVGDSGHWARRLDLASTPWQFTRAIKIEHF